MIESLLRSRAGYFNKPRAFWSMSRVSTQEIERYRKVSCFKGTGFGMHVFPVFGRPSFHNATVLLRFCFCFLVDPWIIFAVIWPR